MAVSRRNQGTRLLVIGLIATSLFTITVDYRGGRTGPLAGLGNAALSVITPLQEAVSKVFTPIASFFTDIWRVSSIKEENAELRRELEALQAEQGELQQYKRELAEANALLGLEETHALETVGARVIAESVSNFEWSITIDKGSSEGVELDMPVLAPDGLAGKVVRVTDHSAMVMLVIDPDFFVDARLSASGELGILVGQRDQPLKLDLIDPETIVEPGEKVETSGHQELAGTNDSLFPPGLVIGEVSEVSFDEAGLTREILVRPAVDFSTLSVVSVVLAEQPDPDDFLAED